MLFPMLDPSMGLKVAGWLKGAMSKKETSVGGGGSSHKKLWGADEFHAPYEIYQPTTTTTTVHPYAHYAPQLQFAPVTSYGYAGGDIIISSPEARTKKEITTDQVSKPTQEGAWDFPISTVAQPSYETGRAVKGTNLTHIAIIAAVGMIGYGLVGKVKIKR